MRIRLKRFLGIKFYLYFVVLNRIVGDVLINCPVEKRHNWIDDAFNVIAFQNDANQDDRIANSDRDVE